MYTHGDILHDSSEKICQAENSFSAKNYADFKQIAEVQILSSAHCVNSS